MKKIIIVVLAMAFALPAMPAMAQNHSNNRDWLEPDNRQQAHDNFGQRKKAQRQQQREAWQNYRRYDYNKYDPRYGSYQADRYYRDGSYYQDRQLANNDRIYRGSNGRYYCRRNDGTTGLIIGALGGGVLGNVIAPNGSKTLGAILGGGAGALIGRSIGRGGVRCN
jgi:Ni/Co efflux regulator RcnB